MYVKGVAKVQVGDKFLSKDGEYEVLDRQDSKTVLVRFTETGYTTVSQEGHVRRGTIQDPLAKSVCGVGFIGVGPYNTKNKRPHSIWHNMINRCYGAKIQNCYEGASVIEFWYNFQNFADWYYSEPCSKVETAVHIDKDILNPSIKLYSPETCTLVPYEINAALIGIRDAKGYTKTPAGTFCVMLCGRYIGKYATEEEAFNSYVKEKKRWLQFLSIKYKDFLREDVYEVLFNYGGYDVTR